MTVRDSDLGAPEVGVRVEGAADLLVLNVTWSRFDGPHVGRPTGVVARASERIAVLNSTFLGSPAAPEFTPAVSLTDVAGATVAGSSFTVRGSALVARDSRDVRFERNALDGQFYGVDLARVTNVTVEGNLAEGCTSVCVLVDDVRGMRVRENRLSTAETSHGVLVRSGDDLLVERNTLRGTETNAFFFSGTRIEFRFNDASGAKGGVIVGPEAETASIHHNNVHGHSLVGVDAPEDARVVARDNWWGCPGGPGASGCDAVRGDVTYDPWLAERVAEAGASW